MKDGFPCDRDPQNMNSDFPFMGFRVALIHSMPFVFTLYSPQDNATVKDRITKKIDNTSSLFIPQLHFCGDFNIHYKVWLFHSNRTDAEWKLYNLYKTYELTQIVNKPTLVLDKAEHHTNLLHLFLASCPDPEKCFFPWEPQIIPWSLSKAKTSWYVTFHRTIYKHNSWSGQLYRSTSLSPLQKRTFLDDLLHFWIDSLRYWKLCTSQKLTSSFCSRLNVLQLSPTVIITTDFISGSSVVWELLPH